MEVVVGTLETKLSQRFHNIPFVVASDGFSNRGMYAHYIRPNVQVWERFSKASSCLLPVNLGQNYIGRYTRNACIFFNLKWVFEGALKSHSLLKFKLLIINQLLLNKLVVGAFLPSTRIFPRAEAKSKIPFRRN
jgi:hypothetical protein